MDDVHRIRFTQWTRQVQKEKKTVQKEDLSIDLNTCCFGQNSITMGNPKFQIYKDRAGEFRFRLVSGNGQIIATGEGYTSKQACENGVAAVKRDASNASVEHQWWNPCCYGWSTIINAIARAGLKGCAFTHLPVRNTPNKALWNTEHFEVLWKAWRVSCAAIHIARAVRTYPKPWSTRPWKNTTTR